MKTSRALLCGISLAFATLAPAADVAPGDLIKAVDQMTPQQAHDFNQTLESKTWQPVPESVFSHLALSISGSMYDYDSVNVSAISPSLGRLDVDHATGTEMGIYWWVGNPRTRFGLRMGGAQAVDSDLNETGYARAEFTVASAFLAANYQFVRTDHWLVWGEVAPGAASVELDTIETPTGEPTTLRVLDGATACVDLRGGLSLRLNPILSLFTSGGYLFASDFDLDEGGLDSPVSIDLTGLSLQLGIGANF